MESGLRSAHNRLDISEEMNRYGCATVSRSLYQGSRYCRMYSAHNWHTALVSERTFRVRPETNSCISNKPFLANFRIDQLDITIDPAVLTYRLSVPLAADLLYWRPACVASTSETAATFSSQTDTLGPGKLEAPRARIRQALLARTVRQ